VKQRQSETDYTEVSKPRPPTDYTEVSKPPPPPKPPPTPPPTVPSRAEDEYDVDFNGGVGPAGAEETRNYR
jgi:hypothetical protein